MLSQIFDVVVIECMAKYLDYHSLVSFHLTCKKFAGNQENRERRLKEKLIYIFMKVPAKCFYLK